MGVLTANATIRDRGWSNGTWAGWQTSRLGYLNQRTFGYALARFAWARNETKPPWLEHVRADVRAPLKDGLRFLAHAATDGLSTRAVEVDRGGPRGNNGRDVKVPAA